MCFELVIVLQKPLRGYLISKSNLNMGSTNLIQHGGIPSLKDTRMDGDPKIATRKRRFLSTQKFREGAKYLFLNIYIKLHDTTNLLFRLLVQSWKFQKRAQTLTLK